MGSISEVKEISGELVVRENEFPAIKSGKEEISVMIPYDAIDALKMKTGSKVSVKGALVPAQNWNITGEQLLRVFELEYEGKKYLVHGERQETAWNDERSAAGNWVLAIHCGLNIILSGFAKTLLNKSAMHKKSRRFNPKPGFFIFQKPDCLTVHLSVNFLDRSI
jgi:hypothetical protein